MLVISFLNEGVLKYFLSEGEVYTFRLRRRLQTGNTWMNDRRGGLKIADVDVKEVGEFRVWDLRPFVDKSSFATLAAWYVAIRDLPGSRAVSMDTRGWLYKVKLLRTRGEGD